MLSLCCQNTLANCISNLFSQHMSVWHNNNIKAVKPERRRYFHHTKYASIFFFLFVLRFPLFWNSLFFLTVIICLPKEKKKKRNPSFCCCFFHYCLFHKGINWRWWIAMNNDNQENHSLSVVDSFFRFTVLYLTLRPATQKSICLFIHVFF